jgi:predicted transposase YbfD/YdcC
MIVLKGCIVTIDAMGCRYKTANRIVNAGADYVLSLKENQKTLYDVYRFLRPLANLFIPNKKLLHKTQGRFQNGQSL